MSAVNTGRTGTSANVATSTTTATLFASNNAATGRLIWNDSAAILYVYFSASAASATACTVPVAAGAVYEFGPNLYRGRVEGTLASGTGTARVTEW